jgi:hypothetical protein
LNTPLFFIYFYCFLLFSFSFVIFFLCMVQVCGESLVGPEEAGSPRLPPHRKEGQQLRQRFAGRGENGEWNSGTFPTIIMRGLFFFGNGKEKETGDAQFSFIKLPVLPSDMYVVTPALNHPPP